MPKYGYVDQAVQGANIYRQAKLMGNQEMMQNGLNMIAQATNALRGITDVQQARQTMQYQREMHPLLIRERETAVERGRFELTQEQEAARRDAETLARVESMIRERPEVIERLSKVAQDVTAGARAKYEMAGIMARGAAAVPTAVARREKEEAVAGAEEAITGRARAVEQRRYIPEIERAAGVKAKEEYLGAEARMGLDLTTKEAQARVAALGLEDIKTQLATKMAQSEIDNWADIFDLKMQQMRAELDVTVSQAERNRRQDEISELQQISERYAIARPYMDNIFQAYQAMQRARQSGNVSDFQAYMVKQDPSMSQYFFGRAPVDISDIEAAYSAYIAWNKDILNQMGFEADEAEQTFWYTGIPRRRPGVTETLRRRAEQEKAARDAADLEAAYARPAKPRPAGQPGAAPPAGATPEDVKNMLDAFFGTEQ